MIAPRPRVAAEELFRVVRPGNTVGMTAWTPESKCDRAVPDRRAATRRRRPTHAGLEEWGDEDTVRERFDGLANTIEIERRTLPWEADSPEAFVAAMERAARPPQAAAEANLPPEALRASCAREQLDIAARAGPAATGRSRSTAEYLLIVARRRG